MRTLTCFLLVIVLSSCSTNSTKPPHPLEHGMLRLGELSERFIKYWGLPDKQYVTTSEELISAGWSRESGRFFKGRVPLEVWVYTSRKTELAFSRQHRPGLGHTLELVGYETKLSRKELSDSVVKQ